MKSVLAGLAILAVGIAGGLGITRATPSLRGTKTVVRVRVTPSPVPDPYPVVQQVVKRVRVPVYVTVSAAAPGTQFATLCYHAITNDLGVYPTDAEMSQCEARVAQGGAPP